MDHRRTSLAFLLAVCILGVSVKNVASRPIVHRRSLLQARPQGMNAPIFLEDGPSSSGSLGRSQPAQQQQPRSMPTVVRGRSGLMQDPSTAFGGPISADVTPGRSATAAGTAGSDNAAFQQWGIRNGANWNAQPAFGAAGAAGAGGSSNWGRRGGSNWGSAPRAGNKGDFGSLQSLTGDINSYPTIQPQAIPVTGTAGMLSQGIRRRGNARAAAQSLAQAYSSGQVDAAAQAMANAATAPGSGDATVAAAETSAVAETVAEVAEFNPRAASNVLAKSAGYAVNRGQTKRYARTMANAFTVARRRKYVPQLTTTVADAITTGGAPARYAYGQAIATAIADGGEGQAAVAEATAAAFCAGGSTASAWASAYAVALSQDSRGCLVLNQAKSMAKAQCGNGATDAFSKAEATSVVLGFCGLMDMIPGGFNYNWSGGNAGSNTNSGNAYGGLIDEWGAPGGK